MLQKIVGGWWSNSNFGEDIRLLLSACLPHTVNLFCNVDEVNLVNLLSTIFGSKFMSSSLVTWKFCFKIFTPSLLPISYSFGMHEHEHEQLLIHIILASVFDVNKWAISIKRFHQGTKTFFFILRIHNW